LLEYGIENKSVQATPVRSKHKQLVLSGIHTDQFFTGHTGFAGQA
jgi:hypothetical protein